MEQAFGLRRLLPRAASEASVAEDHPAHLIAQPLHFLRIRGAPEAFGEIDAVHADAEAVDGTPALVIAVNGARARLTLKSR